MRCRKHQWYLMGRDVRFDTPAQRRALTATARGEVKRTYTQQRQCDQLSEGRRGWSIEKSLGLIPLKAAIDRFCCKSLFGVMSDNFQER